MSDDDTVALDALREDPANARRHTSRGIGVIVKSLQNVGAGRSIVIDENNQVIAGNATIRAANEAGITRVRVIEADGSEIVAVRRSNLSDAEKRRMALEDNRAAELSDWNPEILSDIVKEGAVPVEHLFTNLELAEILADGVTVLDDVPTEGSGVKLKAPHSCPKCGFEWRD